MKKKLFLLLFILSLVGPTAAWPFVKDFLDQTNYENRKLAEFPELSFQNFANIPIQFEEFYNDHVPFKNLFVKAKTKIDLTLLGQSSISAVTMGMGNWMFYTVAEEGEDALADYQRTNLYTGEQEEALIQSITVAKEELERRGSRFFVIEAPNKETIYEEYMPARIKRYGEKSRLEMVIPKLRRRGLPVYDLKESLEEYHTLYQLYYKYDTHWNDVGSFVGSQKIAEILTGDSVPLTEMTVTPIGNCSGDMARMLSLEAEYSDDALYAVEGYLPEVMVECVESNEAGTYAVYESTSENDRLLFLVGDSFSQGLKLYLPKLYKTTVFVTIEEYKHSMLDEYEIDDFVYLTVERNQAFFENMGDIIFREQSEEEMRQEQAQQE